MSRLRFYADEHVARAVVRGLRLRGIDVTTVAEVGKAGSSDEEHLAIAAHENRVILTQDVDFLRLAAAGSHHSGIVYAPQGRSIGEIVRGIVLLYTILESDDMTGRVEFL